MADQDDLARQLLGLARDDAEAGRALLPVGTVSDSIVGFHAQQAVEKALKAVLALEDVDFPFTHDLSVLAELCEGAGLSLPAALDEVDRLSPYGVQLRYGGTAPGTADRTTALAWAAAAITWAEKKVAPSRD